MTLLQDRDFGKHGLACTHMNPFVFCVADFRFPMTMLQNCDLGKPGALASMGSLAPTRPPLWLCS